MQLHKHPKVLSDLRLSANRYRRLSAPNHPLLTGQPPLRTPVKSTLDTAHDKENQPARRE
jgi:hypothetical protein